MPEQTQKLSLDDWFGTFETGLQTDSAGVAKEFSEADLDSIVANFNAEDGVPVVIGHPKTNSPAYGWIGGVRRVGNKLQVKGREFSQNFRRWVADGHWRLRSVRIQPDGKGGYRLVHVGFLGGTPPAIEGLGHVYEAPAGEFFDFALRPDAYTPSLLRRALQGLRDVLVEQFNIPTADRVVTQGDIDALGEHARDVQQQALQQMADEADASPIAAPSAFNAPANPTKQNKGGTQVADDNSAALDAAQAENERLKQQLAAAQRAGRAGAFAAEVNDAVTAHKLTPASAQGLADFMAALDTEQQMDFSAGDGKTAKQTLSQFFSAWLKSLPENPSLKKLGEEAAASADDDDAPAHSYSAPRGAHVNAEKVVLRDRALAFQRAHPGTAFIDAVQAVQRGEK